MQIDWFTWVAQIINFLILVGLLKHFLYGRILRTIDERDQELQERWERAEQEKSQAEKDRQALQTRHQELDTERDSLLQDARARAERKHHELEQQARQEVEHRREQWLGSLEQDRDRLAQDLQQSAGEQVLATAGRVLRELAEVSLEQQVVRSFEQRLAETNGPKGDGPWLQGRNLDRETPVRVTSSFALEPEDRDRLEEAIRQQCGRRQAVEFQRSEDLILGLALEAGAERLAWTAADYLEGLREHFQEALRRAAQGAQETPGPEAESPERAAAQETRDEAAQDLESEPGEGDHA